MTYAQNATTIVTIWGISVFTHIMIERLFYLLQLILQFFFVISRYRYVVTNNIHTSMSVLQSINKIAYMLIKCLLSFLDEYIY